MLTKHGQELIVSDTLMVYDHLELAIENGDLKEFHRILKEARMGLRGIQLSANLGDYDSEKDLEIIITGI